MDPVTAISLASSILTFVDVGIKVLQKANEIRNSHDGSTKENETRRSISDELEAVAARLKPPDDIQVSPEQESLCKVARECQALSKKTLGILESIKPRKPRSISALFGAAKAIRKQGNLEALDTQLKDCRHRLTLSLVDLFRQESTGFFEQILSLTQEDGTKLDQLQMNIGRLREGVHVEGLDKKATEQLKRLMKLNEEALLNFRKERILSSLQFKERGKRFGEVHQPHADTFNWMFEDGDRLFDDSDEARVEVRENRKFEVQRKLDMQRESREKFLGWLASPGAIFHIHGKLGSGKSTLMKFLSSHKRTRVEAKKWAGDKQLVIATFFFWRPGLDLQKSIHGLRRSLLYDILKERHDLIPETMPNTWGEVAQATWYTKNEIEISPDQIREALERVMRNKRLYEKHRFCFFIDGLDEHENTNHADYQDVVKFLDDFSNASDENLKLCLSSKEENVFMAAYSERPSLKLHVLTQFDMRKFVLGRLEHLQNNELRLRLATVIPDRAEGIFFWTSLVVSILRVKVADGISEDELEQHLKTLPSGLKGLFVHILNGLDDYSKRKTYQLVALLDTVKSFRSGYDWLRTCLTLLAFSFLDEYNKDKEFFLRENFLASEKHGGWTETKALQQLRGACGGLIERHEHYNSNHDWGILEYAHRSVPEIFQEESAKLGMEESLEGFNAVDALSHLIFAQVQFTSDSGEGGRQICAALATARLIRKVDKPPYRFLECISSWIGDSASQHPGPGHDIRVTLAPRTFVSIGWTLPFDMRSTKEHVVYSTLCVAAFFGNEEYVEWKIRNDPTAVDSHFKHAIVAHCMLGTNRTSNRRHWEHLFESGFFTEDTPVNLATFHLSHPLELRSIDGDHLSIWQRHQAFNFSYPTCLKTIEQFLECGADTSSTLAIKAEDQEETRCEVRFNDATISVTYKKGQFEEVQLQTTKNMRRASNHNRRSEGFEVYSFRDWIEAMEWGDKDRIFELIDCRGDEERQAKGFTVKSLEDQREHSAIQVGSQVQLCDDETDNEEEYPDRSHGSNRAELPRTVKVVPMILLGIAISLIFSSAWMRLNGDRRANVID